MSFKEYCDKKDLLYIHKDNFINAKEDKTFLANWVYWWHDRHCFIFRTFTSQDMPQMNQAKVTHASWAQRPRCMSS